MRFTPSFGFILLAILALSVSPAVSANEKVIVTEQEIEEYAQAYLETYRDLVEQNMKSKYFQYFDFYESYPYRIEATISTTHGAALQFIPSEAEHFETRIVSEKIEQAIFKDKELSTGIPMFKIGGARWKLSDFSVVTNKGYFLEVPELCSVLIEKVRVDNVDYDHSILIQGSNLAEHWTKETADSYAQYYFKLDIPDAFVKSEDFSKILAYPELEKIALEIKNKRDKGEYNTVLGHLEFEEDIAELYNVAQKYGLASEIDLDDFLKEVERKPSFWQQNPFLTGLITCILSTLIVTGFIIFVTKKRAKRKAQEGKTDRYKGKKNEKTKSKKKQGTLDLGSTDGEEKS